ncbi:Protein dopey-2 [Fasciola gigantica]|uniref:Protein dopey-2 n=1 Tax=Fasciola gigantica TaxID=46835 RepID=A0A504YQE1_FASGI|nr:Protein dopey-2 [Fasciola gigantica]
MSQEDPNDSKFKGFTAQVDKSLKGFEYSTEWADLISALGRLIKVIQSNAKANHIPRSFLVGKRLAQCLHPALPPGVHCKTLECYDVIFRTIGPNKLATDLSIYGCGLFTLLGPSAMTVKPPLFDVFEEHLLPLRNALHPAFLGLLLGTRQRHLNRIVNQYEDGLKACEHNIRNFDYGELPPPPKCPPLAGPPTVQSGTSAGATACSAHASASSSTTGGRTERIVALLKTLQNELEMLALKAKEGNLDLACAHLRSALTINPMIRPAQTGLTVHFSKLPNLPSRGSAGPQFSGGGLQRSIPVATGSILREITAKQLAHHQSHILRSQGLLPGLEQGAEFFERGNRTIELFCSAVDPKFFYTCLWKLMIHSPSIRMFGIAFVINHLNRRKTLTEKDYIYGLDKRILVQSLCCLFGDSVILVQRDALDFVQSALPVHLCASGPGQLRIADEFLTKDDYADLCHASLCVLLRRDASLNRRLFLWLKGGQLIEGGGVQQSVGLAHSVLSENQREALRVAHPNDFDQAVQNHYFVTYSRDLLIEAMLRVLYFPDRLPLPTQLIGLWGSGNTSIRPPLNYFAAERSVSERPFRIMTGLLDRCDLGGAIIEDLLSDLLWYTYYEFIVLKERSVSWNNGDCTAIIRRMGQAEVSQETPDNMLTLMADHVVAKGATRVTNQHDRENSTVSEASSVVEPPNSNETDPVEVRTINARDSANQSTRELTTSNVGRLTYADEFLRTAHLFLSNLDGDFLWGFLERQFRAHLLPTISNSSTTVTNGLAVVGSPLDYKRPRTLNLVELCNIVQFMLSHLPIDTYPGVRGNYLPRLFTNLMDCLLKRFQFNESAKIHSTSVATDMPLRNEDLAGLLQLLESVVGQIFEYIITVFDHNIVQPPPSSTADRDTGSALSTNSLDDLTVIASGIGKFRQFFGAFCVHGLRFSSNRLSVFVTSLMHSKSMQSDSSIPLPDYVPSKQDSLVITPAWRTSFSQLCCLLIQMSNFPFLVSEEQFHGRGNHASNPSDTSSLMQLFCGDLIAAPDSIPTRRHMQVTFCPIRRSYRLGHAILPEWLVCLLYISSEVTLFDLKAMALYTLLELFHASTSVHGWTTNSADPPQSSLSSALSATGSTGLGSAEVKIRLTLPVLSGRLLAFLATETNTFLRLGISLWAYLAPNQSAYHEDAANLLVRLHQLNPPTLSGGAPQQQQQQLADSRLACSSLFSSSSLFAGTGSTVESFILSQMRSADLRTQVDAQARFALLWHLTRAAPLTKQQGQRHKHHVPNRLPSDQSPQIQVWTKSPGSGRTIAAPCWRRFAMGLSQLDGSSSAGAGKGSVSATKLPGPQTVPFYRCVLLLLDNLDVDSPWGPLGIVGTANPFQPGIPSHMSPNSVNDWFGSINSCTADVQNSGIVQAVLREQAIQWVCRALRTGQVDRLIAPLLAALLHPATVRISLKARVLQQLEQTRRTRKQKRKSCPHSTQAVTPTPSTEAANEGDHNAGDAKIGSDVHFTASTDEESEATDSDSTDGDRTKSTKAFGVDVFSGNRRPVDLMSMLQQQLRTIQLGTSIDAHLQRMKRSGMEPSATMLPLHELVMHIQNYDANQVIYALSRIRAILDVAPTLFVHALVAAPVTTGKNGDRAGVTSLSLFGLNLAELLTRHRRALAGGNFYGPATQNELVHTLRTQANLLEVLINELVRIKRRFESNGSHSPMDLRIGHDTGQKSTGPGRSNDSSSHRSSQINAIPDRRWIEATARRTCLVPAVLHCLATATELAHWPRNMEQWFLSSTETTTLPACVRLLLINELYANLPSQYHRVYCTALIRLTQAILELQLWSAPLQSPEPRHSHSDAGSRKSTINQFCSNIIWPAGHVIGTFENKSTSTATTRKAQESTTDSSARSASVQQVIKLWVDAFLGLPKSLACEPLFRDSCLTAHWPHSPTQSGTSSHLDEGALLIDIITLGLRASFSSSLALREPDTGLVPRLDLHPIWYQFVFSTLHCWGRYTPLLARAVVQQICATLNSLGRQVVERTRELDFK